MRPAARQIAPMQAEQAEQAQTLPTRDRSLLERSSTSPVATSATVGLDSRPISTNSRWRSALR
jgi:hypothetical protein